MKKSDNLNFDKDQLTAAEYAQNTELERQEILLLPLNQRVVPEIAGSVGVWTRAPPLPQQE